MSKKIFMFLLVLVFVVSAGSLGLAAEKKAKELKLKGMLVVHPDTKDVKLVTEDYQYHTIYYNKKTQVEATVKAKTSDLEKEMKQSRLPKATVTYVLKDGKPVATKISFKSRAKWGLKKPKKK